MGVSTYTSRMLLLLKRRVVLAGDGRDDGGHWLTTLQWGFSKPLTVAARPVMNYGIMFDIGATQSGLTGLCCQNLNSAVVTGSVATFRPLTPQSHLFLTNSEFDAGTGSGPYLNGADELLLANTTTVCQGYQHVLDLNVGSHYIIRKNVVRYCVSRLFASQSDHLLFENNHITRDGDHFPALSVTNTLTGGLSSEQSQRVVLLNNTFDAIGAPLASYNDGETILSEWASPNRDLGIVTAAASSSLQDTKKKWAFAYAGQGYVVAIVHGVGQGQTRTVTGNTATGLTIDRPWDIIPTAGSRYTLLQPSAEQWLIKGNALRNLPQGILIYQGGLDCAVIGNELTNAGQIYIRGDQRLQDTPPRFSVCWNMRVEDNTVSDTNNQSLAYIMNWFERLDGATLWGVGMLGMEMRRNTVTAYAPTSDQRWEGFGNFVNWVLPDTNPANDGDIGILGTIFQDNSTNRAYSAYYTGSGVNATTIWHPIVSQIGQMLSDTVPTGAKLPSQSTLFGAPPAGFVAATGTGAASLTWQSVSGASGYQIFRASAANGPWITPLATVHATNFMDIGLIGGNQYYYIVKATYSGAPNGKVLASNIVTLQAKMAIPVNLNATPGDSQVMLSWQGSAGAASYTVSRSTVSGGPFTVVKRNVAGTSCTDTGLSNGTLYYYVVSAVNAYEMTTPSAAAAAKPLPAPAMPVAVKAVPGNGTVTLTWNAAARATDYRVYRSTTSGSGYARIGDVTATAFADSKLTNGKTYYYVVRGVNTNVEGTLSAEVAAAPVAPPQPPNTLSVKPGNGQLTLGWKPSPTAVSFNVYRSTQHGGPYSRIASVTVSPWVDKTVIKGVSYYYVMTGVNLGGESGHSTEVTGIAPANPAAPAGLTAAISGTQAVLSWPAVSGATGYNVYLSLKPGGPYTLKGPARTTTTTAFPGVRCGPYYYVVTALNVGGESPYSPEAVAVTAPPAPTNLTTHAETDGMTLAWATTICTGSYHIYRSTANGGPYGSPIATVQNVALAATLRYRDTHMTRGKTYWYVVRAVGNSTPGLESANSAPISAIFK